MSKEAPAIVIGDDLGVDPSAPPPTFVDFSPTEYFVEQFGTAEAAVQLENFVRDSTVRHLGKAAQSPVIVNRSDDPRGGNLTNKVATRPEIPQQLQTNAFLIMGASFLLGAVLVYLLVRK